MLSWEWRCSWGSADRRCSNYIWVINNFIAYQGASYIRDITVSTVGSYYDAVQYGMILLTATEIDTQTMNLQKTSLQRKLWNVYFDYFEENWPYYDSSALTHWGRVTNICIDYLTIINSDKGLSPGQCQAIIWTNAGISLIGPLGISIKIYTFSFKKTHLKISDAQNGDYFA